MTATESERRRVSTRTFRVFVSSAVADLKAALARLRMELGDDGDRYATELPEDDVDRPETWTRVQ